MNFIDHQFPQVWEIKKHYTNYPLVLQIPLKRIYKKTKKKRHIPTKIHSQKGRSRSTRDQFTTQNHVHHHCWVCWPEARDDETEHGWRPASASRCEFGTKTNWWLNQPLWKIWSSKWIISPIFGVKIKKIWNNHHRDKWPSTCLLWKLSKQTPWYTLF